MKVLDLQCSLEHRFEGWFGSEGEFQQQLQDELLECPLCGTTSVTKRLSAPRLNLASARNSMTGPGEPVCASTHQPSPEAAWLAVMRQLVASTEDVGEKFSEVARKMHYGETQERSIRGQATPEQTRELLEEGIPVLPLPQVLIEPLH